MRSPLRLLLRCLWMGLLLLAGRLHAADGEGTQTGMPAAQESGGIHRPLVVEVMLHDTLQGVSLESFRNSMRMANRRNPAAILLNLSTPGGLPQSAAAMVAIIEQSQAPVLVYVEERATHVSGEGMRLLQAGDVRAMAPQTTLVPSLFANATSHIAAEREQDDLRLALVDIAARHSRSPTAVTGLLDSTDAISAEQALSEGAIDTVAIDEAHLLAAYNGVRVRRGNGTFSTLHLENAVILSLPMTLRDHLMRALMNPDLTVLLLALGGLLLYLEVNTPGGVVPGAAGLFLVLLAVYALFHMPLGWEGLALLASSGVLLLLETHFRRGLIFAGLSMLTLVIGLRLLVHAPIPELEVNWGTAVGAGIGFGGVTTGLLLLGLKARRAKVRTGAEAMLGWLAIAQTPLAPEGEILVRGELWRARVSGTDAFVAAGEAVKVEGTSGTVLEVAPLPNLQGA